MPYHLPVTMTDHQHPSLQPIIATTNTTCQHQPLPTHHPPAPPTVTHHHSQPPPLPIKTSYFLLPHQYYSSPIGTQHWPPSLKTSEQLSPTTTPHYTHHQSQKSPPSLMATYNILPHHFQSPPTLTHYRAYLHNYLLSLAPTTSTSPQLTTCMTYPNGGTVSYSELIRCYSAKKILLLSQSG